MNLDVEALTTTISTPYGVVRYYDYTHPVDAREKERSARNGLQTTQRRTTFYFEVLAEEGGLTLPDGKTYVTVPSRQITWELYRGISATKQAGTTFPVKARKSAKALGNYETTYSEAASFFSDIFLDLYLTGQLNVDQEDTQLIQDAHYAYRKLMVHARKLKQLESEIAAEQNELTKKNREREQELYPKYGTHSSQAFPIAVQIGH